MESSNVIMHALIALAYLVMSPLFVFVNGMTVVTVCYSVLLLVFSVGIPTSCVLHYRKNRIQYVPLREIPAAFSCLFTGVLLLVLVWDGDLKLWILTVCNFSYILSVLLLHIRAYPDEMNTYINRGQIERTDYINPRLYLSIDVLKAVTVLIVQLVVSLRDQYTVFDTIMASYCIVYYILFLASLVKIKRPLLVIMDSGTVFIRSFLMFSTHLAMLSSNNETAFTVIKFSYYLQLCILTIEGVFHIYWPIYRIVLDYLSNRQIVETNDGPTRQTDYATSSV